MRRSRRLLKSIKYSSLNVVQQAYTSLDAVRKTYSDRYGEPPDYVSHYWPCNEHEISGHITRTPMLYDVCSGFNIPQLYDKANNSDIFDTKAIVGGHTVRDRLYANYQVAIEDHSTWMQVPESAKYFDSVWPRFDCFADNDWAVIVVAESLENGCFEFTLGGWDDASQDSMFLKLQPYYMAIQYGSIATLYQSYLQTKQQTDLITRTEGQGYVIAWCKRGDNIEHWVDGVKRGTNSIDGLLVDLAGKTFEPELTDMHRMLNEFKPFARVRVGHSSRTAIQTTPVIVGVNDYNHMIYVNGGADVEKAAQFIVPPVIANETTQYAGTSICSWPQGQSPDDTAFAAGLNALKADWMSGNKTFENTSW